MKLTTKQVTFAAVAVVVVLLASQVESLSSSSPKTATTTATQARQSPLSTASSIVGAVGSLLPNLVANAAPLVLLFGLGALMMPALGLNAMGLLREGRRSSNEQNQIPNLAGLQLPGAFAQYARPFQTSPQDVYYFTKRSLPGFVSQINTGALAATFQDLLERVSRAIENADKTYGS